MKRLASVVLLVAILLSVTGCKKKITSGEVIEKNYTPAHTSVNIVPIITTNGKSTYKTIDNAADLAAMLCEKYNIPVDHIIWRGNRKELYASTHISKYSSNHYDERKEHIQDD